MGAKVVTRKEERALTRAQREKSAARANAAADRLWVVLCGSVVRARMLKETFNEAPFKCAVRDEILQEGSCVRRSIAIAARVRLNDFFRGV